MTPYFHRGGRGDWVSPRGGKTAKRHPFITDFPCGLRATLEGVWGAKRQSRG